MRCLRNDRIKNCVRERSVCNIESFKLSVWFWFWLLPWLWLPPEAASYDDAVKSSIVSTCARTRSIMRLIKASGHGSNSETARSATQRRVSCWWSSAVDSGEVKLSRSTDARMSSMSMFFWRVRICGVIGSWFVFSRCQFNNVWWMLCCGVSARDRSIIIYDRVGDCGAESG